MVPNPHPPTPTGAPGAGGVEKNPEKGPNLSQETWDAGFADNWRQGSAIQVTAPETSDFSRILGNPIENAAQGIDLHCDRVIVFNNIINHAHIGMKAMHGSRNVLITGNQFSRNDLRAIGLMPGAAAHRGGEGKPANADGGSIIANEPGHPRNLNFSNNLLPPGPRGVCNQELAP